MRISRESLIDAARDYVDHSAKRDRSIVSVYLIGSVLSEDPLLGGATDIDLVYIHNLVPPHTREIQRFTDDVCLDIVHHHQEIYEQPRELRLDPLVGPPINTTRTILFDSHHWFEYTQAIITAQFDRIDHHADRIRKLLASAREEWRELEKHDSLFIKDIALFLSALQTAINSITTINGPPLTERRFMRHLAERCQAVQHPELCPEVSSMLGFNDFDFSTLPDWIDIWETDLFSLEDSKTTPVALHHARKNYYASAAKAFFEEGQLESSLWILLTTWTIFVSNTRGNPQARKDYLRLLSGLGFGKELSQSKIATLDAFIDRCDEIISRWVQENGG